MKRSIVLLTISALLLSGCYNAGEGAYTGGQFGYVIGSAIGGLSGGHRGHHWGALIGTVSGAAAGAAIGAAKEKAREEKHRSHDGDGYDRRNSGYDNRRYSTDDSGYDAHGRGDDRIDLGISGPTEPPLEIRNAAIEESRRDGVLTRGEECRVTFEVHNTSAQYVYDVRPLVGDVTGNKHVKISPNLLIESIAPHQGVRYTATILADKRLKDGEIKVMVGVAQGLDEVASQTRYFTVPTAKGVR